MEEQKNDMGASQESIRELRRQLEDRMVVQGYSKEEMDILLHVQPYKADQLLRILIVFDNNHRQIEDYIADVIMMRFDKAKNLERGERLELARMMIPDIRKGFLRLFSSDEGPALKAQMPLQSRIAFMTEERRRVWFG